MEIPLAFLISCVFALFVPWEISLAILIACGLGLVLWLIIGVGDEGYVPHTMYAEAVRITAVLLDDDLYGSSWNSSSHS